MTKIKHMLKGFYKRYKEYLKNDSLNTIHQSRKSAKSRILRYIKYSLGEILLIVVGILIAWQINNFSATVKDNEKELVYLLDLVDELRRDSLNIVSGHKVIDRLEGSARKVVNYVAAPPDSRTDSLDFLNQVRSMIAVDLSLPKPIIWNELQSTGNLRLIKNRDMIEALYTYYDDLEGCQGDFEDNVKPFVLKGRFFDSKTFSVEDQDDYFDNWRKDKVSSDKVFRDLLTDQEFENIAKGIIAGTIVSRLKLSRIQKDLQSLIDEVNLELRSR